MPQVGKYQTIKQLGRGSVGVVYSARDVQSNQIRALKFIYPHLNQSPDFIQRLRELNSKLMPLDHPGVLQTLDLETVKGQTYLVSPLMANNSLKQLVEQRAPFPEKAAYKILSEIIDCLDFAQSRSRVHGGLKPSNVLFDENQKIHLSDFGLTSLFRITDFYNDNNLFESGSYLASEIWNGEKYSTASDQFALGCILYEMLTGRKYIEANSAADQRKQSMRIFQQNTNSITKSGFILSKLLAPNPADRYPNYFMLKQDIQKSEPEHSGFDKIEAIVPTPDEGLVKREQKKVNQAEHERKNDKKRKEIFLGHARVQMVFPDSSRASVCCLGLDCPSARLAVSRQTRFYTDIFFTGDCDNSDRSETNIRKSICVSLFYENPSGYLDSFVHPDR